MTRLPLQTLPAFRAVAQLQSVRAAAQELHLTHSAVSQQIKLLESHVGVPLFDRRGRGVVLNAAGAELLRATAPALDQLAEGVRNARSVLATPRQSLRLTVLPSFAQRWLMPRLVRWHALHPDIELDIDSSLRVVDLQREGFHAALRVGGGPWRRLDCERLVESRRVVVCAPQRAARLAGAGVAALSAEPLLGDAGQWTRWFALAGGRLHAKPVADFNDAGLMLQAAEHDMGIAMVLELTAADALQSGSLRRLTRVALDEPGADSHWLVNPPELAEWPPLAAFRHWLRAELAQSERMLDGLPAPVELGLEARPAAPSTDSAAARPAGTSTAGRTGNRSRGRSG